MRELSEIETELLELLGEHSIMMSELRKINVRYLGALGKLKQYGYVTIERIQTPKKDKLIKVCMEE